MADRPIIMSGPEVNAIMAGTKTQFRRVMPRKSFDWWNACGLEIGDDGWPMVEDDLGNECRLPSPYDVGDTLWVRETLEVVANHGTIHYAADGAPLYDPEINAMDERAEALVDRYSDSYFSTEAWKVPSIHAPRWASRLSLLVTEVRAQRVQDISEEDAVAEGVPTFPSAEQPPSEDGIGREWCRSCGGTLLAHNGSDCFDCNTSRKLFRNLWDRLNAKRGFPFSSNPWVFAYTFEMQERGER